MVSNTCVQQMLAVITSFVEQTIEEVEYLITVLPSFILNHRPIKTVISIFLLYLTWMSLSFTVKKVRSFVCPEQCHKCVVVILISFHCISLNAYSFLLGTHGRYKAMKLTIDLENSLLGGLIKSDTQIAIMILFNQLPASS